MKSAFVLPITKTILVVAIVAGFGAVVATTWPLPDAEKDQLPDVAAELEQAAPKVSFGDVAQILDRPLFHENRRKPVAVAKEAPKARPHRIELPFQLAGIMGASTKGRTAYLLNTKTQETIAARVGEQIAGWHIVGIDANSVVLEGGGTQRTLTLESGG